MINLEAEVRNGYTVSAEMKKVWAVQMQLVKELLRVCDKYGLKTWAGGGTLLGVIREKGYIPWDDDIDMLMLREDYEKLISIAKDEFESPYYFQSHYTEKNYFRGHSQLRLDNTAAILPMDLYQPFHQGIFIDIFVYDEIPDVTGVEWDAKFERADKLSSIFWNYTYPGHLVLNPKTIWKILQSKIICAVKGASNLYEEYNRLFSEENGKGYGRIACPCFERKDFKSVIKQKEWYSETLWMPFEDMEMPVPIGYDMALRTQYGDNYMTPRKAPSLHGEFLVLDTEKSYSEYLKPLRRKFRKQRVQNRFQSIIGKIKRQ